VRDERGSLVIGLQEQVANHSKRRWSKAWVVSVTEKASQGFRCGTGGLSTSELPFKCRKWSNDTETGE
jgi:hypothetical protein